MEKEKSKREEVTEEYLQGRVGFRELAKKHGVSHTTIAKWIHRVLKHEAADGSGGKKNLAVISLQKQLDEAQLRNKLLDAMLDIGKEQYGIDLRKKAGTKQSRE
jgi:transposase-like protein